VLSTFIPQVTTYPFATLVLPPGESYWICAVCLGGTDRQTDAVPWHVS